MRFNPISKFIVLCIFSLTAIAIKNVETMLLFALFVISFSITFGNLIAKKSIFTFSLTLFLFQIIFEKSGDVLFQYSFLSITRGGLEAGILIAGRFVCIVLLSSLFVSTTKPTELSSALASAGLSYRYGFLLVLAMRFVPIFKEELATVREAQIMRGLNLEKSVKGIYRTVRYTLLPLLISSLSRINTLSASMEGRGFGAYKKRNSLHEFRFSSLDFVFLSLSISFAILLYYFENYLHLS